MLGTGGHDTAGQNFSGNCYNNVGLGRSPMENPPIAVQSQVTQILRVPGTISNLSWGLEYNTGSGTFDR